MIMARFGTIGTAEEETKYCGDDGSRDTVDVNLNKDDVDIYLGWWMWWKIIMAAAIRFDNKVITRHAKR